MSSKILSTELAAGYPFTNSILPSRVSILPVVGNSCPIAVVDEETLSNTIAMAIDRWESFMGIRLCFSQKNNDGLSENDEPRLAKGTVFFRIFGSTLEYDIR
jgi:hypothetical protein